MISFPHQRWLTSGGMVSQVLCPSRTGEMKTVIRQSVVQFLTPKRDGAPDQLPLLIPVKIQRPTLP